MDQYQNQMNNDPNDPNLQNPYQNGGPTYRPQPRPNGFEAFAVILGLCSIASFCTGVFSIVLGALGILFVCLARRHGKKLSPQCKLGLGLSVAGLVIGAALTAYTLVNTVIPVLTDPAQREQLSTYYEQTLGVSLDEILPIR